MILCRIISFWILRIEKSTGDKNEYKIESYKTGWRMVSVSTFFWTVKTSWNSDETFLGRSHYISLENTNHHFITKRLDDLGIVSWAASRLQLENSVLHFCFLFVIFSCTRKLSQRFVHLFLELPSCIKKFKKKKI